jgi:L-aspartate oxidase
MLADDLALETMESNAPAPAELSPSEEAQVEETIAELQQAMWADAGLLRTEATLRQGLSAQASCEAALLQIAEDGKTSRKLLEAKALACVAQAILHSAMARTESRGAHFRGDFPKHDDEHFKKHSVLTRDMGVEFQSW